ncbi:Rpn family recombination-promoting nuclease/putative transposase [Clostridium tagluense]|nr:Rpn family recombination-promoting nuclease/putative transposase [Clostridium tagluense]MBU3127171.1 Rpn family recombination-promoting nuclease/putative transposase [Clostridium tagluense]MCB2312035.1 Rpn family recombination-promoting nuclease/putative transposase [Clostridium tagluense]MCB2316622.1 Rpn family recombination-promoting nuclease/putative transposase [Clostridium tagluense]MCB2321442.1 Rpn family recombination-promoting nuclease/putative transposase [Clostridium tagluense]MCB
MERLKPLNDFIFKKTFGEEETKDNLIALLNAILSKKDRDKLVTLEIVENKELTPELIGDKTGIIDVRAKTEDGTQLEIEVQLTNQHNMDKRTMWYWGEMFSEGIKKGEDYKNLPKVITINIVDFEYIKIPDKFHTTFHLWEDEVKDYMLTDVVEIHFIEMEKFRKLKNKNLKEDKLQRWLSFFREDISQKELKELTDMDVDIRKAEEKIEYLSSDPKTLELYKARERSLHERANMISSAKDEGINEGIEKGKIKVAENFLNMGLSVEQVAKGSELSIEKIIEIKKMMQ